MWNLKSKSEFEYQAEAMTMLRNAGYEVRGEVSYKPLNQRGARFDLLVMKNGKPALIIELKNSSKNKNVEPKKCSYYRQITGLPVIFLKGDVSKIVSMVDNVFGDLEQLSNPATRESRKYPRAT